MKWYPIVFVMIVCVFLHALPPRGEVGVAENSVKVAADHAREEAQKQAEKQRQLAQTKAREEAARREAERQAQLAQEAAKPGKFDEPEHPIDGVFNKAREGKYVEPRDMIRLMAERFEDFRKLRGQRGLSDSLRASLEILTVNDMASLIEELNKELKRISENEPWKHEEQISILRGYVEFVIDSLAKKTTGSEAKKIIEGYRKFIDALDKYTSYDSQIKARKKLMETFKKNPALLRTKEAQDFIFDALTSLKREDMNSFVQEYSGYIDFADQNLPYEYQLKMRLLLLDVIQKNPEFLKTQRIQDIILKAIKKLYDAGVSEVDVMVWDLMGAIEDGGLEKSLLKDLHDALFQYIRPWNVKTETKPTKPLTWARFKSWWRSTSIAGKLGERTTYHPFKAQFMEWNDKTLGREIFGIDLEKIKPEKMKDEALQQSFLAWYEKWQWYPPESAPSEFLLKKKNEMFKNIPKDRQDKLFVIEF